MKNAEAQAQYYDEVAKLLTDVDKRYVGARVPELELRGGGPGRGANPRRRDLRASPATTSWCPRRRSSSAPPRRPRLREGGCRRRTLRHRRPYLDHLRDHLPESYLAGAPPITPRPWRTSKRARPRPGGGAADAALRRVGGAARARSRCAGWSTKPRPSPPTPPASAAVPQPHRRAREATAMSAFSRLVARRSRSSRGPWWPRRRALRRRGEPGAGGGGRGAALEHRGGDGDRRCARRGGARAVQGRGRGGGVPAGLAAIRDQGLDANVSIKLTLLGLPSKRGSVRDNVLRIAGAAREQGSFVRIDMEDSSTHDATFRIYREAQARHRQPGGGLQA